MMKRDTRVLGIYILLAAPLASSSFHIHPVVGRTQVSSSKLFRQASGPVFMSSEARDDNAADQSRTNDEVPQEAPLSPSNEPSFFSIVGDFFRDDRPRKSPPIRVDDFNILFYDIILLINLSVSISFWAVHRMDPSYIGLAVSEGSLMCILWIASGLYTGAFLYSAVDGHYGSSDERGGPKAAALLGFHTFLNAVNLRLLFSLIMAILEHRPAGSTAGEQLLPLEIGFGFLLMAAWRGLHSFATPRL